MPYCPKCDMEFVDGITICSDCGGPLVESEAVAKAMKKQEKEQALLREHAMMEQLTLAHAQKLSEAPPVNSDASARPVKAYVDKARQYDDLKSSASAFLIIGGLLTIVSVLCWLGFLHLPMAGASRLIFQGVLTAMGLFSLAVFFNTAKSARQLQPEIDAEKQRTEDLLAWFSDSYTAEGIDSQIPDRQELSPEELSLKRFQIIQDYLITGKDLPDPDYVEALSEEIYTKLYEA